MGFIDRLPDDEKAALAAMRSQCRQAFLVLVDLGQHIASLFLRGEIEREQALEHCAVIGKTMQRLAPHVRTAKDHDKLLRRFIVLEALKHGIRLEVNAEAILANETPEK
jgi:hypothetical protein